MFGVSFKNPSSHYNYSQDVPLQILLRACKRPWLSVYHYVLVEAYTSFIVAPVSNKRLACK